MYHSSKYSSLLKNDLIQKLLAIAVFFALAVSNAHALYQDKTLSSGKVRVHYSEQTASACDAVLLGVGTAMGAKDYDKLSEQITKYGYVVAILDHAPGDAFKTDENQYKNLAEDVKLNLLSWLGDTNCTSIEHWVMGGHSAGGQAAQNAVAHNQGLADAVFSIDPYNMNNVDPIYVPAMYWGFEATTCFVEVEDASKKAYNKTHAQRAFYKVADKYQWGPCGYSPKYFHCSFCDGHCPVCTNCKTTPNHFYKDVARSVDKFIRAAFYGNWSKSALTMSSETPLTLYVDSDKP